MVVLAIALIAVGTLSGVALYTRAGHQVSVVVAAAKIPAGAVITAGDLATATTSAGTGLRLIPAGQLSQVAGEVAATDLQPGEPLVASDLTTTLPPGPGQVMVPVPVRPSFILASGLAPGYHVLAIATPAAPGQSGSAASSAQVITKPVAGVVYFASLVPNQDGNDVVDLIVSAADAAPLEEQASTGQIAIEVTSRNP
jgi:hypothetical protein